MNKKIGVFSMKIAIQILCLLITIGAPVLSQAQLVEGDRIMSGTFSLYANSSSTSEGSAVVNGPKTTNIDIALDGMQIVSNNTGPGPLGLGVRVSLRNNIEKQESGGVTVTNSAPTFELAPFARSYLTNTAKLGIFAEGILGLSFGKVKQEQEGTGGTTTSEVNTSGFRISARPGLSYFVTEKIGLDFLFGSIGYESTTTKLSSNSKQTESDFGIRFNMSTVQVGISYKF